ncbi:putative transcriptional regulator cudA [Oncorhynchus nerka]|uniref:putative transcriptional regulator cudA n=1 Tax=Oncorhynchus nerka TaxID=8023 RepID=UPI0031B80022
MPQQMWYRAKMLQKENHLAAILQQPLPVWHPSKFPQQQKELAVEPQQQKELAVEPQQQKELAVEPQQQKELAVEPQQQKELAVEPQQQKELAVEPQVSYPAQLAQQLPNPIPQQLWHVAQISQQQLAPMSQQKHYESTEDASGSSQASIVERSGVIPSSSYISKSHYKNGRTGVSQISYTPREAMPVDSGNAPKDGYVSIGAPSIYPTLVKDSAREI